MTTLFIYFLVCFGFSILFSIAEMAFVSSNKIKIREMADQGSEAARSIVGLQQRSDDLLIAILIGNNIANAGATAIFTYALEETFGLKNEWVVTAIMAPLLIVLGEMVPKDYGRLRSHQSLFKLLPFLRLLAWIFHHPTQMILKGVDRILGPSPESHKSIFVSEDEFRSLIEESTKTGVLEPHEKKIIDTILDFERIRVESVMIPLERVSKIEIIGKVGEVKAEARKNHVKMVLVYEEIPSIIVGMLYTFDLLFEEDETKGLKKFLRAPIFLPTSTSIEKAFLTLKHKRQSYAVVTDARGDAVGAVAIEKLLAV